MTTPTEPGVERLLPCPLCRAPAKFLPAIAAWNTRPKDLLLLAVEALDEIKRLSTNRFVADVASAALLKINEARA